jgi:hypothetical protein
VSPPGAIAPFARPGVSTPLEKNHLIRAARLILDNCGIAFSEHKITRLVIRFLDRAPNADGHVFFQFLTNAVQMSEAQKRSALSNPDVPRAISYSDPTGETAVNNVMRRR